MAGKMKMVVFMVLMVAAATLSNAQTTHVVGDGLGWNVPPGGAAAYSTWASQQTFTVGDVLVFNFTTNLHDVAEVTESAFNSCDTTNPISLSTTGPTRITLNATGSHYYICTFPRHCSLGQLLAINVSGAATPPSPTPTSIPPPASAPAPAVPVPTPAPSAVTRQTYIVGDGMGWNVPPGRAIAYQTWARNKTFVVGDTLVFNFVNQTHNVAELTKTAFESCDTNTTISLSSNPPVRIVLATPGEHFFTCTFPRHCSLGQLLAINVTGTPSPSPSSASAPSPFSTTTPASSPAPSGSTTSPPTPATPSPTSETSSPPSPNAAPSLRMAAALPASLLTVALAFLY